MVCRVCSGVGGRSLGCVLLLLGLLSMAGCSGRHKEFSVSPGFSGRGCRWGAIFGYGKFAILNLQCSVRGCAVQIL